MDTTQATSLAQPAPGAAAAAIAAMRSKTGIAPKDTRAAKPPKTAKPVKAAKAKKSAKVRDPNARRVVLIKGVKHDVTHYRTTKTATGNSSLDCGDSLAKTLQGQELDEVYRQAAKQLGETERALRERYAKLNPGMQRMNLGNRMRADAARKAAKAK